MLSVFVCMCLLGGMLHEVGHWIPCRAFQVKNAEFVLIKKDLGYIKIYLLALNVNAECMRNLSTAKKIVIFLGGSIVDIISCAIVLKFCGAVNFEFLGATANENMQNGLQAAAYLRIIGIALNLVPIKCLKNDGWRVVNPHLE